jgi:type IV fimbrial biogenesis protein FimT
MKTNTGFTLMEMMVVIAVIAAMAGVAIPGFMSLMPGMRLNGATRQVAGDLMAARMKAVKENNKFRVLFSSPSYQILDDDNNNNTADDGEAITTKNIQDEYDGVTFTANNNPIFHPRGTATSLPTITIYNGHGGCKKITVSIAGRVKIDECTDGS